jgi:hypothetical protein
VFRDIDVQIGEICLACTTIRIPPQTERTPGNRYKRALVSSLDKVNKKKDIATDTKRILTSNYNPGKMKANKEEERKL